MRRKLLRFLLNLHTFLASFHAASRAPFSCHSVSSRDRSSNFVALGLRWWGSLVKKYSIEWFWSRIWLTRNSLREFHTLDWTVHVRDPLKNRLHGFMSWKTQPKCRAFVNRRAVGLRLNSWWVSRLTSGLSGLSWLVTVDTGLLHAFVQIFLQHGHSIFCHHYFDTCCWVVHQTDVVHKSFFPNLLPLLVM